jgi:hypothetical protein
VQTLALNVKIFAHVAKRFTIFQYNLVLHAG